jgi:hypothetical protein
LGTFGCLDIGFVVGRASVRGAPRVLTRDLNIVAFLVVFLEGCFGVRAFSRQSLAAFCR